VLFEAMPMAVPAQRDMFVFVLRGVCLMPWGWLQRVKLSYGAQNVTAAFNQ